MPRSMNMDATMLLFAETANEGGFATCPTVRGRAILIVSYRERIAVTPKRKLFGFD